MSKVILVVAAHPDDEVLGCGGTIAKHTISGDKVHVVIMAEGITSRDSKRDLSKNENALSRLQESAVQASKVLGVSSLDLKDFPDNRMDSVDLLDVIKVVEDFIDRYRPDIVYTHHMGDLNVDHRVVHNAVVTACRPLPSSCVESLLFFEVPSSTEWNTPFSCIFSPNWFVDISQTINIKMSALKAYNSEVRDWPHPRSIPALEHLARWRGASIGVDAAEAFILGRKIIK